MRESHEVLRDAMQACGPKTVSAELGVSLSSVYKWTQECGDHGSGARNPLDRVADLMRLAEAEPIIQWLCHKAGGFFVYDPSGKSECRDLLPATNEIIQEFADMLAVIAAAGFDNRISASEARMVRQRWEELKTVTETFVKCCEQGHFTELRSEARKPLHPGEDASCGCGPSPEKQQQGQRDKQRQIHKNGGARAPVQA